MKSEQMEDHGSKAAVIQNLKDAGCTQEMIDCCISRLDEEDMDELMALLEEHRSCLLGKVHEREKQIHCLDYLVYQIMKRNRGKER